MGNTYQKEDIILSIKIGWIEKNYLEGIIIQ